MKIPFDIKFRPQIESGEYKVETRDGRKAQIIHWDLNCTSPIVAVMDAHIDLPGEIVDVFSDSGRAFDDLESPSDLFIVTPEPEFSDFELKLLDWLSSDTCGEIPMEKMKECVKARASELLPLAIDARAKEMDEALEKSELDKDSIPYHLIEFMCNLYTCPNWKEIEDTAELYVTRIKAAALKDLPRWKKVNKTCFVGGDALVKDCYGYYFSITAKEGGIYILKSDLEKLPGFKED